MDTAGLYAALDPDDVRPGGLGLVVVLALVVATALLLRSFTKQLKKIDFEEQPDDGPRPPGARPVRRPDGPRDAPGETPLPGPADPTRPGDRDEPR